MNMLVGYTKDWELELSNVRKIGNGGFCKFELDLVKIPNLKKEGQ